MTPTGIEKVEKGTLNYFDLEVWSNLNTGTVEQYFEEKNRVEGFERSRFVWKRIVIGLVIGTMFAIITQYVGLKVGLAISGGWYIMALIGMAFRWHPSEINIASSATNAATYVGTGFIFTFPAMYLLMGKDEYALGVDADGNVIRIINSVPPEILFLAFILSIMTGMLGVLYFIILRRIWLVEDPLHIPGWEPSLQLVDIANDRWSAGTEGDSEQAKKSIRLVGIWITITMIFTFLRDFPVNAGKSVFYSFFGGEEMTEVYSSAGDIQQPLSSSTYTMVGFGLIPIQLGIGWFMRFKVALLVNIGTFFTWFIIVPLAVTANIPAFDTMAGTFYPVIDDPIPAWKAYVDVARPMAVGAILGGGITALIKMAPTFKSAAGDLLGSGGGDGENSMSSEYVRGMGWYEWPASHIKFMAILTLITTVVLFTTIGGFPLIASLVFAAILVATTFFLGAIAVKVMGETGTEPVSGTSFIVMLALVLLFVAMGLEPSQVAIMALLGTTLFAGAISMSGDIILDFKTGLYIGNRPYHLVKAVTVAIPFGAAMAIIGAVVFGQLLADGTLDLLAPQANAFASITRALVGGESLGMMMSFLAIGLAIGVVSEITTGMGTAFGLGMYFPLALMLPMILGGLIRDIWEKRTLEPWVESLGDDPEKEKKRTLKVLDTYMIATGLIIGEALMGTIYAFYSMLS